MAADQDLSNINEPKSQREMFQRIMWMIEQDREDRQEDREKLEKFISVQGDLYKTIDSRIGATETCTKVHGEKLDQLEKRVNAWNLTNTLAAIGAFITALFLKSS